jgi:hypothetical protein
MPACGTQGVGLEVKKPGGGVATELEAEESTDAAAKFPDYSLVQLAPAAALWAAKKPGIGVATELEAEESTDAAAKFPDYSLAQLAPAAALSVEAKPALDSFPPPVASPHAPVRPGWALRAPDRQGRLPMPAEIPRALSSIEHQYFPGAASMTPKGHKIHPGDVKPPLSSSRSKGQ